MKETTNNQHIVTQSETIQILTEAVKKTKKFHIEIPSKSISCKTLIQSYNEPNKQSDTLPEHNNFYIVGYAKAILSESFLEQLANKLRPLLSQYIDYESDTIGSGLVSLTGGMATPSLIDFTRTLIKASVILGPETVAKVLFGWISGEPIRYKVKVLFKKMLPDEPVNLEGMEIMPLPNTTEELLALIPHSIYNHDGIGKLRNRAILTIDSTIQPALYKPSNRSGIQKKITSSIGDHSYFNLHKNLNNFCNALSLARNACITWDTCWDDLGYLLAFRDNGSFGYGSPRVPSADDYVKVEQHHMTQAWDIYMKLYGLHTKMTILNIATHRWVKSKLSKFNYTDNYIDLRIALEALFLGSSDKGELSFRLATNGAWYLGANPKERCEYFNMFRSIYTLSSKMIHASYRDEVSREDHSILEKTQNACRDGILKRIEEGQEPKWNEVIMGVKQT
ncbi:MAG: HEPN domain-containing protein [Candidatus Dadabacteria bacterium]|nr:HEPN domain-containing protein [Candidatus Dadabacteria bacterium]